VNELVRVGLFVAGVTVFVWLGTMLAIRSHREETAVASLKIYDAVKECELKGGYYVVSRDGSMSCKALMPRMQFDYPVPERK